MKKFQGTFLTTLLIVIGSLIQSGCASRKAVMAQDVKGATMAMNVFWIKDKGNKYDLKLSLKNTTNTPTIVYLHDLECFKNNVRGELKHTFFNTGERTIDFKSGQMKSFNMVCNLGGDVRGKDFKIAVSTIYDNPSGDGKSSGKKVDGPIVWEQTL